MFGRRDVTDPKLIINPDADHSLPDWPRDHPQEIAVWIEQASDRSRPGR